MAYLMYLRLWRGKYLFVLSIFLNIVLLSFLLKEYLFADTSYNEQKIKLFRRQPIQEIVRSCYVFVLILTAPNSRERRDAIRTTWLKLPFPKGSNFVHKFAVGSYELRKGQAVKLADEQEKFGDLLFLTDLKDSYQNLTLKVLKSFTWIKHNVDAKFILKVDDDSFVRLGNLVSDLELKEKYGRIYWGFFRGDANVKTAGPWKEPNWILCDKYLPYANGGGYILSQDLVHYISNQQIMLQLFNSEDVSVGTWLAPVKLNRIHDVRFDTEYTSRGCNNLHLISHKQTIKDMFTKYQQLTNNGRLCEDETVHRLSFEYDWKSKPSHCCKRTKGIP